MKTTGTHKGRSGSIGSVAFATLGCKVNRAETEHFARGFGEAGFVVVPFEQPADVYVINSCTVTHVADRKSRQLIRQARRANPAGLIVATGCYTEIASEDVAKNTPIDLIVPNQEKSTLVEIVLREVAKLRPASYLPEVSADTANDRTRAFVKIQDGCNSVCSYCIIPYARGREHSAGLAEVVAEVRGRLAGGRKEIVLTGVHLGTYGEDLTPAASLRDLLRAVLDDTDVPRVRLSSIEPWSFDPAVLDLWQSERLCRHFHLAIQSGSNSVLRRMRRPYDVVGFDRLLREIRARVPDVAVTTDVIVGFPGETEAEFEESLEAVRRLQFAAVHVFPFSARYRTTAARLPDQVSLPVKRARTDAMLAVASQAAAQFQRRFLGRRFTVLFERVLEEDDARQVGGGPIWEGLTDNYMRVLAPSADRLANRLASVELIDDNGAGLIARLL